MDTQHKAPVKPQLKKPVKPQPKAKQAEKVELTKSVETEQKVTLVKSNENTEKAIRKVEKPVENKKKSVEKETELPKENYNATEIEFTQQNNQINQAQQGSLLDFAKQANANDENIKKQLKEKKALNLKKSKKFIIIGASVGVVVIAVVIGLVLKSTGALSSKNKDLVNAGTDNAKENDGGASLERIKKELEENGYEVGETNIESEVDTLTIPSSIVSDEKKVEEFKEAYKKAREEQQLDPSDAYIAVVKEITGTSVNLDPNNRYNPDAPELTIQGSNGGANSSMEGKGKGSDD